MQSPLPTRYDPADFMPDVYTGPPTPPDVCFHYTLGTRARKITQAGVLLPHPNQEGKQPLLWFSTRSPWEPAACRSSLGSVWAGAPQAVPFRDMFTWGTVLVRFAIPEALAPMGHYAACERAGMKPHAAQQAAYAGTQLGGNIEDWRATLEPIRHKDWLSIERWVGTQWEVVWQP